MLTKILVSLHVLVAAAWVGGHVGRTAVVVPAARRRGDVAPIQEFEASFSRIGLAALLVQVVTGVVLACRWIGDWRGVSSTFWPVSRLVLAKIVLLGGQNILAGNGVRTNASAIFVTLKPWSQRRERSQSVDAVIGRVWGRFADEPRGHVIAFNPAAGHLRPAGLRAGAPNQNWRSKSGEGAFYSSHVPSAPQTLIAGTEVEHVAPVAGSPPGIAIPRLVELHGPRLYSLASRLCGNAADAEDMVQDVFLQAHRKWHTFKGDSNPGTWLYAIAAHSCKARMRRRGGIDKRMPAVSQLMPWNETRNADLGDGSNGSVDGPVARAIERESAKAVHDAILTLPENFRVPLVLKEMLELSIDDVAKALHIKPETVKTRVHRARLLLRKAIVDRRGVPTRAANAPTYEKQVCLDLLKAKLDAMDHGRGFPIGQGIVCERCQAVFAELDLAQNTCARLADGKMPQRVRSTILKAIREAERETDERAN